MPETTRADTSPPCSQAPNIHTLPICRWRRLPSHVLCCCVPRIPPRSGTPTPSSSTSPSTTSPCRPRWPRSRPSTWTELHPSGKGYLMDDRESFLRHAHDSCLPGGMVTHPFLQASVGGVLGSLSSLATCGMTLQARRQKCTCRSKLDRKSVV